jgi:hypothetical protein
VEVNATVGSHKKTHLTNKEFRSRGHNNTDLKVSTHNWELEKGPVDGTLRTKSRKNIFVLMIGIAEITYFVY